MIQFLKYRTYSALFSSSLLILFFAVGWYHYSHRGYVFSYSIDFTGGTQVLLKFDQAVSAQAVRSVIAQQGWDGVAIRELSDNEILVRVKEFAADAQGLGERICLALQQAMPDRIITILESEGVGPGIGQMLRTKSVRAVLLALIAMLAYIAFRFWSLAFAVGAVVALFHDAFVMLAMFLFFDREISINVIGAILAVLGYSINDTIVIFSQIRENAKKMASKGASIGEIVNVSLNQTLKRTILTSVSTGLPVIAMLLLGGEALFDFSFALLIGIIFGTYSSIYIASPVMMLLYRREKQ